MPSAANVVYYLAHPVELRAMIQWKLWHQPVHERDTSNQTETLKRCFYFLDKTSRSFAAVIKELHPEILMPMCIFYIILRGLDTIEDDMTIPLDVKDPILRGFDDILEKNGWSFTGNHAREKDRDLLVEFDCVIQEFAKIKPPYQKIIKDITKRMGNGMADYCNNAEHNENGVDSTADYIKYCHYVAGLVGEGCTRLFVEAGLANAALLDRPELMESMGQFLQQTNIIRDIKEDWDEHRRFWPKEIWSKYVDNFEDLMKPEHREAALNCNAEMISLALTRTDDCIFYLAGIKEQSVFNFCAIPQTMAIATLDVCFRNPEMFKRNVKITRGQACQVMMESTGNLRMVCEVFKRYAASIRRKNSPHDPNFLDISITCGKMEKFIETIYPSQPKQTQESLEKQEKDRQQAKEERWEIFFVALSVLAAVVVCGVGMIFIAWMMGARFDIVFDELRKGNLIPPKSPDAAQRIAKNYDRSEL